MQCPNCQHQAHGDSTDSMPGVCPACGIAYQKWIAKQEVKAQQEKLLSKQTDEDYSHFEKTGLTPSEIESNKEDWKTRFFNYACFMPSNRHESAFWGHTIIYVFFVIWGLRFIFHGVDWEFIGSSFLHNVNLPFHEYGHVMFSSFGRYWMFLGGSVFQILLPLMPLAFFMIKQRDNFAASIMLWWSGQNFIDVSPYIADAPYRFIPLTTPNIDSHDWWNLLTMSGSLDSANTIAWTYFISGALIILLSNIWGGFLLYIEFKGRTDPDFVDVFNEQSK